jgi:lipid-A-disaccharide synthase
MKPKQIMVIAGEASGDTLAAELVTALREELIAGDISYTADAQPLQTGLEPRFFGAGGARMKAAGVDLAFDLTEHSVIGFFGPVKHYFKFLGLFKKLLKLAAERQPDVIVCVDFSGFNRRFAAAIKQHARARRDWFHDWQPKIVQYVSPQVWASRESRVFQVARDYDLLLSIFPFEAKWYAERVPDFPVEFIGHPILDRHQLPKTAPTPASDVFPRIVLLPGSRIGELARHLPVMIPALRKIQAAYPKNQATMVLPNEQLRRIAMATASHEIQFQVGGLLNALAEADIAIACTGTVTMECALFGVPAVTLYRVSWPEYEIGKRIAKVKWATMPNILAGEAIYPEFIQYAATPENIANAAMELLRDEPRRARLKIRLKQIIQSLGGPGAAQRGARAIAELTSRKVSAAVVP